MWGVTHEHTLEHAWRWLRRRDLGPVVSPQFHVDKKGRVNFAQTELLIHVVNRDTNRILDVERYAARPAACTWGAPHAPRRPPTLLSAG